MAVWSSVEIEDLSEDFRLDAEHYQPEYLRQEKAMAKLPHVALGKVASVSDGNHLSIADDFADEGVRYLRGQDLSDFFIGDADPIYIPERTYKALARSHMFAGDVLVGIVGTIGSVGLVTKRHGKLTGNCKLAIVRARELPAEYLAAYLASRVGQNEIQRRIRGAVQMGLILPDLRNLPVIIPSDAQGIAVVRAVQGAERNRERSRELVAKAEKLLTASIGLAHLDLSVSLFYERDFSDLQAANRFGAEYFMPCKQRVLDALAAQPGRLLGEHCSSVRELFDPRDARRGENVRNFDLSDALDPVLDDRVEPMSAVEVGSTKKNFRAGDIVISRLRSYLREIALVRTSPGVPAVGSSEFIVLRPREDAGSKLTPETLLIYLRSLPVQTILKWSQDGSQHPRFNEDDLLAIPVPSSVERIAPKVDALVNEALTARAEAARLLEAAKSEVERLVLGTKK
jgi:type I restriction enzyme S subunit